MQADRDRAQDELREKEELNFALFNYNPVLTVVVDTEGRVLKSNRAKLRSGDRLPDIGDVMYRDYAAGHEVDMYGAMMECIRSGVAKTFPDLRYKKKRLSVTVSPFPRGAIIVSQDITERVKAEEDRIQLIDGLQRALEEVETLRGFLPICAHCKRIRDDSGLWHAVEEYISKRTRVDFSHTMCPECTRTFYPELWAKQMHAHA